jgi:iron-sulfur cluster assembly accessory protein
MMGWLLYLMCVFLAVDAFRPPRAAWIARGVAVSSTTFTESPATAAEERVILITEKAFKHLEFMRSKQADEAVTLRMGVRAGGCSGMSYDMTFIKDADVLPDDHVEMYGAIKCVVDPKSLLFLFGLQLDYSDELIGGGFKFANPNAGTSCGCGKSFGI